MIIDIPDSWFNISYLYVLTAVAFIVSMYCCFKYQQAVEIILSVAAVFAIFVVTAIPFYYILMSFLDAFGYYGIIISIVSSMAISVSAWASIIILFESLFPDDYKDLDDLTSNGR